MDRDPVLLTVSKLDNGTPEGIENTGLKPVELSLMVKDFSRLMVEDQRSIASSIDSRNSGSRNFENIKVEWRNLRFTVNKGKETKTLVNNMSGIAKPGTLTAIMGPSGAGKTTLLNLLSGF
ncbi:ABC transporter, putative [Ixodes scapularis]|uniref:ABC transporter, putative n=1 Tax=Ixodes scapularis TaxID=6945 RepID=B7PIA4_IXOSC|nr:ABC transporter, putative [Ixodes scapularis]|eukprot:XP_002404740.1 ABC transporter, putative [Ixodes scapularis]